MRRLILFILLAFFTAVPAAAQDAIDLTIYRDADSFTIFAPSAPYGLALQVTLPDGRTLTQSLVAYPAFRGAQSNSPACFRLERAGSNSPTPQDCQSAQIFIQTLTDGDVFWHDSTLNQDLTVMIVRDGVTYGVCAAGIPRCTVTFIPALEEVALCDGAADLENHEVLVVIATFRQISGNPLEPHYEWEIILDDAIAQLKGEVNARVLVIPQMITTQEEALTISDCFNATLVIWGRVTAARVQSNYTAVARWSNINVPPESTNFEADPSQPQQILDQMTVFVSLQGGDTEYTLNFVLAQLTYFGDQRDDALSFINQAIASAPNGREAEMGVAAMYFYQGNVAAHQENYSTAVNSFTHSIELNPDSARAFFNRGMVYVYQEKYQLAISDLTRAIEVDPNLPEPYSNRGILYYIQGDYENALADYTQAITLDPNLVFAYNNRGNAYMKQGEYKLAMSDYDQAIALMPDYDVAYDNRGRLYAALGQYKRAITDYTQAISLNPHDSGNFNDRGIAYYLQEDYDLAIADFDEAIRLQPIFGEAYNNRGLIYAVQGQFEQAIPDFIKSLNIDPSSGDAYKNLGLTYDAMQQYDEALLAYHHYLELVGDNALPYILNRVAELGSATPTPSS